MLQHQFKHLQGFVMFTCWVRTILLVFRFGYGRVACQNVRWPITFAGKARMEKLFSGEVRGKLCKPHNLIPVELRPM